MVLAKDLAGQRLGVLGRQVATHGDQGLVRGSGSVGAPVGEDELVYGQLTALAATQKPDSHRLIGNRLPDRFPDVAGVGPDFSGLG